MKYLGYILIALIPFNVYFTKSALAGSILAILYIAYFGLLYGKIYLKSFTDLQKLILGITFLLSIYSIILTTIFYFSNLTLLKVIITFLIISSWLVFKSRKIKIHLPKIVFNDDYIYVKTSYYISIFLNLYFLYSSSTIEVIRTPWEVLDYKFYVSFLASLILLLILNSKNKNNSQVLNISLFFFVTLNIANIIYRIGYGYDGFIHQATERLLLNTGDIFPKPAYYVGHYSIVVFSSMISFVKYTYIDRLLPSIIASFGIPVAIYIGAKKYFNLSDVKIYNLTLTFLILPFSIFVNPTPQATSLALTIITIFLTLAYLKDKSISFYSLLILFLATFLIHPISAIPIFILLTFTLINKVKNNLLKFVFLLFSSLLYPTAFYVANFISANKVKFNFDFSQIKNIIQYNYSLHYNFFLDLAYLISNYIYLLFFILVLIALLIIKKRKTHKELLLYFLTFSSLIIGYFILLLSLNFTSLPANEQLFYANRIFRISFYILLPFIFYLATKIPPLNNYKKVFLVLILFLTFGTAAYFSYPRYDDYNNTKFYNLSKNDILAVNFIKNKSDNYVVLASQMTSAAAIKEFGFDHNLITSKNEKIYFYPIPTGQKLYSYYLSILKDNNTKELIQEVKSYTRKETVFVVLNSYWSNYPAIKEKLQAKARNFYNINNKISIFEF